MDVAKYICIMWVMLSHLEASEDILKVFYSPFYLSGFFFVSGYVYRYKHGFKSFFIKKVYGLFVPWLFFSIFDIILSQIISFNTHASLVEELKWNFIQIRGKGDGVWFVAALFVAYIPFYFFISRYEKSKKLKWDRVALIGSSFALAFLSNLYSTYMNPELLPWKDSNLPWHIEYIFIAMFWMVLGYLFKNEFEKEYDEKVEIGLIIILFVLYMLIIYVPFAFGFRVKNSLLSIINLYLLSIMGVFILIYICKRIFPSKYLLYIGQNTLICFALHGKIYSVIQTILKRFAGSIYAHILENTFTSSLFAIIFTFIISIILIIPIYIINRWLPFLIGRKYKRQ